MAHHLVLLPCSNGHVIFNDITQGTDWAPFKCPLSSPLWNTPSFWGYMLLRLAKKYYIRFFSPIIWEERLFFSKSKHKNKNQTKLIVNKFWGKEPPLCYKNKKKNNNIEKQALWILLLSYECTITWDFRIIQEFQRLNWHTWEGNVDL